MSRVVSKYESMYENMYVQRYAIIGMKTAHHIKPCKIQKKKYLICAWELSLNKSNYALKSFVKNI